MVAYRVALLILYGKALSLSFLAFAVSLTPRVSMLVWARAPRTRSSGMGNSFSFGERSLDGSSECERVSQRTCERAQATRKHSFVPRERTEFVWNDCGARLKFESWVELSSALLSGDRFSQHTKYMHWHCIWCMFLMCARRRLAFSGESAADWIHCRKQLQYQMQKFVIARWLNEFLSLCVVTCFSIVTNGY